jgi:cytoskeletal protein RodZ
MRGKAILIALALVLVIGGAGAAAWVATKDNDHSSSQLLSGSPPSNPAPDPTASAPSTSSTPATPPDTTSTEEQPPGTTPTTPATPRDQTPPADQSPAAPKRKTHFKREHVKSTNDEPERKFTVPPAREFSGDGNARLGTVNVKTNAILRWRSKGRLEIRFGRENFPIVAPTRKGQLVLPPFLFEQVRVLAARSWKITISPQ